VIGEAGFPAESAMQISAGMTVPRRLSRPGPACDDRNLRRACVFFIDRLLRRYYGVHEFSPVGDNVLRISVSIAEQRIEHSLAVLATHVETNPSLAQCKAFRAEAVFLTGRQAKTLSRIAGRLGFGARIAPRPADPGHTMLAFALAWACQPSATMPRRLRASRNTFWMSRRTLRDRHLSASGAMIAATGADRPRSGEADR